jgi:hypothetical protein
MGEERNEDIDSWTCTSDHLRFSLHRRELITNIGQCGQDNTTIQTESTLRPQEAPKQFQMLIHMLDRRSRHHNTNHRLQRRVRNLQQAQLQCLGMSCPPLNSFTNLYNPLVLPSTLYTYMFFLTTIPGPRRTNLHPPLLALLLRQHGRRNLRH